MRKSKKILIAKAMLITSTCVITVITGSAAYASTPADGLHLNPLPSNASIENRMRSTRPVPISSNSEEGRIIAEFLQQYKTLKKQNQDVTKSISPRSTVTPFNENKAFLSYQSPTTVISKKGMQSDLKLTIGSLGTPLSIRGIDKQSLLHSDKKNIGNHQNSEASIKNQAGLFFNAFKDVLKLNDPADELHFDSLSEDKQLDQLHSRYSQYYQGIAIWGGDLIVHQNKAGDVLSIDANYIPTPEQISIKPGISAEQAIISAQSALPMHTLYPDSESELVIYQDDNTPPVLAWQIKLDISLNQQWISLVDANTSEVILHYNSVPSENVQGQGVDTLGVTRPLNVWQSQGTFFLNDTSKPMFDGSADPLDLQNSIGVIQISDARNQPPTSDPELDELKSIFKITSDSPNSGWLEDGVAAAFNFSETYDYFLNKHGRNSLDGKGATILAVVRYGKDYKNAFFRGDFNAMFFGDGRAFSAALDVVGHELTHGITSATSNLIYRNQSGAINEAMSDIFGEAIERRTNGQNDWLTGTTLQATGRNLKDPGSIINGRTQLPYPSKMSEFRDLTLEEDNGGVHINSSIINHAFYQLAEGLSNAVGFDQAADIFYRANTVHLLSRSTFIDTRRACIDSANELFGDNSAQSQASAAAFDHVEIFDTASQPDPESSRPVDAVDSVVMIFKNEDGNTFTGRREAALGDPQQGSFLTSTATLGQRPAVSGNGTIAAFVRSDNTLCTIRTDGTDEKCASATGTVHAVAFSPDSKFASVIFRDTATGKPKPSISLIDVREGTGVSIPLQSAVVDDAPTNNVEFADAMDFTADSRFLIYDAFNNLTLADGNSAGSWSMYALDIASQNTYIVIPPSVNTNVGNPNLSNIHPTLMAFDSFDSKTGVNSVILGDLATGEAVQVGSTGGVSFPALNGDDSAVIYSQPTQTLTGFSLFRQALQADSIKPSGQASLWLPDAVSGTIYRRGTFTAPASVDIRVSQSLDKATISKNETVTVSVTIKNNSDDNASNIVVTNNSPSALNLVSSTLPTICKADNTNKITCKIDSLRAGNASSIILKYRSDQLGTFTTAANATSSEQDVNEANNSAFSEITVSDGSVSDDDSSGDSSSGGGGGTLSWLFLSISIVWLCIRRTMKNVPVNSEFRYT